MQEQCVLGVSPSLQVRGAPGESVDEISSRAPRWVQGIDRASCSASGGHSASRCQAQAC